VPQQEAHVVEVVELRAQAQGGALHGEEVVGLGDEDAQVRQLEAGLVRAARAQEGLHGVVGIDECA
jgi:hypothetical protein